MGSESVPRRSRPLVRRVGAVVSAVLLLGATAGVVLAGESVPVPGAREVPPPRVAVPATTTTLACAGAPSLVAGEGMAVDPALEPGDVQTTTRVRALTLPRAEGAAPAATYAPLDGQEEELDDTGTLRLLDAETEEPGTLRAEPAGDRRALATGATVARTDAGDLRGLLATPCLGPGTSTWLVGGSTETGSSAELVLSNTGLTPATVDLAAWGSTGPLGATRASGILVPPQSQERVLLEGTVDADPHLALRVDVTGGAVAASVQTHEMTGVVPAGLASVVPAAPPATELTVPGVVLTEQDAASSALRVVNPGQEAAEVRVVLLGPDGRSPVGGAESVVVEPGGVHDVSLAGVEPGSYGVNVVSDVPVTAGALVTRVGEPGALDPDIPPTDRAWSAAAEPLTSGTVTVPDALPGTSALVVTNPSGWTQTVTVQPMNARNRQEEAVLEVPSWSTVRWVVRGGDVAGLRLTAESEAESADPGVVASLVLTAEADDGELISVLPVLEDPEDAEAVPVDLG
ncbi:DUF5719 family protein [Georgenia sp. 10Sc9-8]|uniref:DUF5719 family protein n=1 Tax=Georgenia halotolerans TaxID=3028317 RepID=A0ABT5TXS4_9MICO|nr:DUF5719 family protein [Georgenia halotolerans]